MKADTGTVMILALAIGLVRMIIGNFSKQTYLELGALILLGAIFAPAALGIGAVVLVALIMKHPAMIFGSNYSQTNNGVAGGTYSGNSLSNIWQNLQAGIKKGSQ